MKMNWKIYILYVGIALLMLFGLSPALAQEDSRTPHDTPPNTITSIDWSPDGLLLATANNNGAIQIRDAASGTIVHDLITAQPNPVLTVAWNPAGTAIAATVNENVYIWERDTWQVLHILQGHVEPVWSVAWSPDGTKLAGVNQSRNPSPNFLIWDTSTGQQIQAMETQGGFYKVAWSPDNSSLAATIGNGVALWDVSQTSIQGGLQSSGEVIDAQWSPDGTKLAVVGESGVVAIWDVASQQVIQEIEGHIVGIAGMVFAVEWSPDGSMVASAATDGTVKVWDPTTGQALNVINVGSEVYSVTWSPDGGSLAYGGEAGQLAIKALPIANAGPDQTVTDTDGNGSEVVALDGSASSDPDGTIASYEWSENGNVIATGATPQVTLGVGVHTIILTVTDNDGLTATDDVVITVEGIVTPTPTATPTNTPTATPTSTPSSTPTPTATPVVVAHDFVVNTTGDESDSNTGDDLCDDGTGVCTLRAAIEQANASQGKDRIRFNIPGNGPHTIQPTRRNKALPTVTEALIIDGTSQPGYTPTTPMIEINGSTAGAGANGIRIAAGDSIVQGLVINRFTGAGVRLDSGGDNLITGNFIGTDPSGTLDLGNGYAGVEINNAPNNVIGGTASGAGNVISGNDGRAIYIYGSGATGNRVEGNLIGTDVNGTAPLGNYRGVYIEGSPNNLIGGSAPGAGNVISASEQFGVYITAAGATDNLIQGNFIGTDASGNTDLGNATQGVHIQDASNNTVSDNLISGNNQYGVYVYGSGATGNQITGNTIGLSASGTPLGNTEHGIYLQFGAADNTVGGVTAGTGNTIAHNGGDGVLIYAGTGNAVLGNAIFANTGLGIDLYPGEGVNPNDAGDADSGTNTLQNYPVVTSVTSDGVSTTVSGTLDTTPSTTFRLEFFVNTACDPAGNGEGELFLAAIDVTTEASGMTSFTDTLPVGATSGSFVTVTATDPAGNTSEFSACTVAP
jgi:CSLREA domain-containing protein